MMEDETKDTSNDLKWPMMQKTSTKIPLEDGECDNQRSRWKLTAEPSFLRDTQRMEIKIMQ